MLLPSSDLSSAGLAMAIAQKVAKKAIKQMNIFILKDLEISKDKLYKLIEVKSS